MNRTAPPEREVLEERLIVRFSGTTYQALVDAARANDRTPSAYVRYLVKQSLGMAA